MYNDVGNTGKHERIAVRDRARCLNYRDVAVPAGQILHYDLLTQRVRKLVGNETGYDIVRPPGRVGDEQMEWSIRVGRSRQSCPLDKSDQNQ